MPTTRMPLTTGSAVVIKLATGTRGVSTYAERGVIRQGTQAFSSKW